jgi:hypothetical protein
MATISNYRIPEERLAELTAKLEKLGRRSVKLGLPPITFETGAPFDVAFTRDSCGTCWPIKELPGTVTVEEQIEIAKKLGRLVYFRFVPLTLVGETPRLAGYEFVATLQHLTDDTGATINMLRSIPSFKGTLPVEYRSASPENCDHCHKKILTRKETFIVRHESGKWMQVGRTCTQDFLGGIDPHAVAAQLSCFLSACESCEESELDGMRGNSGDGRVPIERLLEVVAALVRVDGWTSRGRARLDDSLYATADAAISMFNPPSGAEAFAKWKKWSEERKPTAEDLETAEKALTHAREVLGKREDLGDYEHNLYVATTQASVGHKLIGITASLISYYLKEMERLVLSESRRIATAGSVHFGEVGKRADYYLTCTRVFTNEGNWGTTYIHSLVTVDGNLATWFASSNPEMKPGVVYRVSATVKSHGEYKGAQQTILTRLTIYTDDGRASAEAKEAKRAAKAAKKAAKEAAVEAKPEEQEAIA